MKQLNSIAADGTGYEPLQKARKGTGQRGQVGGWVAASSRAETAFPGRPCCYEDGLGRSTYDRMRFR